MGVCHQLPVNGGHMILGKVLASDKVWAKGEPKVVKLPMFPTVLAPSVTPLHSGNIFPGCAITRAASCDAQSVEEPEYLGLPDSLLVDLLAGSQLLHVAEQKADSSLTELFDRDVPASEGRDTAQGYFLQKGLLANCHSKVLQMSHGDVACHLGISKVNQIAYCTELSGDWEDGLRRVHGPLAVMQGGCLP